MDYLYYTIAAFSMLGALDRIFGCKLGLGKEFERGCMLLGTMALSMIGMIVISPFIAELIRPLLGVTKTFFHLDPSIIPASLFANDMGGASLAAELAEDELMGSFNGLVVSSMMGCTLTFTIPTALVMVNSEKHKPLLMGLLIGIVTIPIGCFVSGIMCKIPLISLLINLLPIIIISVIISFALIFCPGACVKVFSVFGLIIKAVITIGLALGILRFLTGIEIIKGLATLEEGAAVCINAAVVMTGSFPLIFVVSKLISTPLRFIGSKLGISGLETMGLVSSLATNVTTLEMMNTMDKKGVFINAAFAVSGAFTFAGHLAFTVSIDPAFLPEVIVGKLTAGFLAIILSLLLYKKLKI